MVIADRSCGGGTHGARDVEAVNTNVMDEVAPVSKYADALPILDNGKKYRLIRRPGCADRA